MSSNFNGNLESWKNLTQNVPQIIGNSVCRVGIVMFKGKCYLHIRRAYYYTDDNGNIALQPTSDGVTMNSTQFDMFRFNIPRIQSRIDEMELDPTALQMEFHIDGSRSIVVKRHLGFVIVQFKSKQRDRIILEHIVHREISMRMREWRVLVGLMNELYLDFNRLHSRLEQVRMGDAAHNRNLEPISVQLEMPGDLRPVYERQNAVDEGALPALPELQPHIIEQQLMLPGQPLQHAPQPTPPAPVVQVIQHAPQLPAAASAPEPQPSTSGGAAVRHVNLRPDLAALMEGGVAGEVVIENPPSVASGKRKADAMDGATPSGGKGKRPRKKSPKKLSELDMSDV